MSELPKVEGVMHAPETPPETEAPFEQGGGWLNRLAAFRDRPLGKLTTNLAVVAALAGTLTAEDQGEHNPHLAASTSIVEELDRHTDRPEMSLVIDAGNQSAKVHLSDWKKMASIPQSGNAAVRPNAALQELISTNDPLTNEIGLTPAKIENPASFAGWVKQQAHRPDLLEGLNVTHNAPLTPRQLVDLSASIVIANIDYDYRPQYVNDQSVNYDLPMDKNLQQGNALQCEGYAAATLAVFNELKQFYPEELKNTYMSTQSGIDEGHVWNLVVEVQGPSVASLAFIDAAGDDPSYKEGPGIRLGFMQLIEGLFVKKIITADTFRSLVNQYDAIQGLNPKEKFELDQDQLYLNNANK